MTSILVLGAPTSPARLHQILGAAVERLGLTEVRVVGGSELDDPVTAWCARRYKLRRYWGAGPEGDVVIIFKASATAYTAGRVIEVDKET